jgi:plasmid stability protein
MQHEIQRAAANVRMPVTMKRELRVQAAMNDRSFNEEVVLRLEQTMQDDAQNENGPVREHQAVENQSA